MKDEIEIISDNWWLNKCTAISKYLLSYGFCVHIILIIVLAIIQLRFSIVYDDQCTIYTRIILYLFIIGIIQIIYSFNGILLIIFSLLYNKYFRIIYFLLTCFVIHQILLIFTIIWFIIGNYLVFRVRNQVQHTNSYNYLTYCHYALYHTAFWTIFIYYIIIILFSIILIIINIKWFIKQCTKLKNQIKILRNVNNTLTLVD
jgi:hypothetical protein